MALLSNPEDYDAVRAAIDLSLDADVLPNDVIALDIYQGAAEDEVLGYVPNAESVRGPASRMLRRAAILMTASYLAGRLPNITSEHFRDGTGYSRTPADLAAITADLRAKADNAIDEAARLLQVGITSQQPFVFALAPGSRGR